MERESALGDRKLLVIGQPVLDHIVDVDIVHQVGTLLKVMDIDAGWVVFKRGAFISTEYGTGKRLVFGPFLDYEDDVAQLGPAKAIGRRFRSGAKVPIPPEKLQVLDWREDLAKLGPDKVGRLGYVNRSPGGGATNCCYIISQIFPGLPMAFTGIYSRETDQIIEDCLKTIVADTDILPVNDQMPINVVLEGISKNRIIFKFPQPRDIEPDHLRLESSFLLVNTAYNVFLASAALTRAITAPSGVMACTESLLSEHVFPADIKSRLRLQHGEHLGTANSIFHYFRTSVLPAASNLTYIFNEDEFHHLVKFRARPDERIHVKDGDGRILFDQLILGMQKFREWEGARHLNLVITVGEFGAFWLDAEDDLHYCAVLTSEETGKVEGQKNAIGDLFAGVLTGLLFMTHGRCEVEILDGSGGLVKRSTVPAMLIAASAAADAGVFDGFHKVRARSVNSNIHLKTGQYRFLGKLGEIKMVKNLESLENMLRTRVRDLTKGNIKVATVLEEIVSQSVLR